MKKLLFAFLTVLLILFSVMPLTAFAEEEALVISKDTDIVRYGKKVVYTAYVDNSAPEGTYMWFVNDVKQDETSNTFTYTHKESGEVSVYCKYGVLVSNTLTANINYTLVELLIYYGLAVLALAAGIPLLVLLSRRNNRSPLDIAYKDTESFLHQIEKLGEFLESNKNNRVKNVKIMRLSLSLNSSADAATLAYEETQTALLKVASDKFEEAYNYIHGIKITMPKEQLSEKISLALLSLKALQKTLETAVKPNIKNLEQEQ